MRPVQVALLLGLLAALVSAQSGVTPTPSSSRTPSISPSISATPSITPTRSVTPSITPSRSPTPSITPSMSATPSSSPSITPTPSISQTPAPSPFAIPFPNACNGAGGCIDKTKNPSNVVRCGNPALLDPADVNNPCQGMPEGIEIYNSNLVPNTKRKRDFQTVGVNVCPVKAAFQTPTNVNFDVHHFGGTSLPAQALVDPANTQLPAGYSLLSRHMVNIFTRVGNNIQIYPAADVYMSMDYRSIVVDSNRSIDESTAKAALYAFLWQNGAWVDVRNTVSTAWRYVDRLRYNFNYRSNTAEQIAFFLLNTTINGTTTGSTTTTTTGTSTGTSTGTTTGTSGSTTQQTGGTSGTTGLTSLNIPPIPGTGTTTSTFTAGAEHDTTLIPDLHRPLPLSYGPDQTPGPVFIPTPVPLSDNPYLILQYEFRLSPAALLQPHFLLAALLLFAGLLLA